MALRQTGSGPTRKGADAFSLRARRFWQRRQSRAAQAGYSGYLLDESPACIGERRFEGEWRELLGLIQGLPGRGRCLDLGCGTGLWLQRFASLFERAEGWDYAPAMAKASRARLKAAGIQNAEVRCGDIRQRKGRAVFDLIFVGGVLMYTPEPMLGPLLTALRRLLKPGGRLILRESTHAGPTWQREDLALRPGLLAKKASDDEDYVAVYRSRQALASALRRSGFVVLKEKANVHYKLSDLTEDRLRQWDRLMGGRLRRDPKAAEQAARWIHRTRALLLYPEYYLRPWKLQNRWSVCAPSPRT